MTTKPNSDKYFYLMLAVLGVSYMLTIAVAGYYTHQERMEKLRHTPVVADTTSTVSRP